MFSGITYENSNRVNLIYWHVRRSHFDTVFTINDPFLNEVFAKQVISQPWWPWAMKEHLEIMAEMHQDLMRDSYIFVAYTRLLPKDETFFKLKYQVLHLHDTLW